MILFNEKLLKEKMFCITFKKGAVIQLIINTLGHMICNCDGGLGLESPNLR